MLPAGTLLCFALGELLLQKLGLLLTLRMNMTKHIISVFFPTWPEDLKKKYHASSFNKELEKEALLKVALWATRFTPVVTPDQLLSGEDSDKLFFGINLDVTGCARLFGGYPALLQKITTSLLRAEINAQVALAPTLGGAWALSRYGTENNILATPQNIKKLLSPLPLSALRLDEQIKNQLQELHIYAIGELLLLPKKSLLLRFPPQLVRRLNQALGKEQEPITPIRLPEQLESRVTFRGANTQKEAFEKATRQALKELLKKLENKNHKPSLLEVTIERSGASAVVKTIPLSLPTLEEKHLWRLLQAKLENISLGNGLLQVRIRAQMTTFIEAKHTSYLESSAKDDSEKTLHQLIDTLVHYLGQDALCEMVCCESHQPENSYGYTRAHSKENSAQALPDLTALERPSVLFETPRPIQAMAVLPDKPPFWIRWENRALHIKAGTGPERIAEEWWEKPRSSPTEEKKSNSSRDYFRLQLESGEWVWVYRNLKTSEWFLHGIWA